MKLRHKILTTTFLILVFLIIPVFGTGAMWIRHVGLLPSTAVVFPSNAAAMDRFMAAALKPYYGDRVGICDGTNDHVEIQAALDAVRDVKLSVGQFNCEVTIDIDNRNQTLQGCGRNTILATTTAGLIFLSAVGGPGMAVLTGIVIKDIQIDGGAGEVSDAGIYFEYVDYGLISGIFSLSHKYALGTHRSSIYLYKSNQCIITNTHTYGDGNAGIYIDTCHYITVIGNYLRAHDNGGIRAYNCTAVCISGNTFYGIDKYPIYLDTSLNCAVTGNVIAGGCHYAGIYLTNCDYNTISGNNCWSVINGHGIQLLSSSYNTISGNSANKNKYAGIHLDASHHNLIGANSCVGNSQYSSGGDYDDICLVDSDYNILQGNLCRAGTFANKPRYGINISNAACDGNMVTNNDIHDDGFGTGSFNDAGTGTVTVAGNRV